MGNMCNRECRIVIGEGSGEFEDRRSRFIAHVWPVKTAEDADDRIKAVRKQYWDARHNCHAFVVGMDGGICRSSDDGEPSGTAGKPILEVINGEGLTNVLIVVTRYFGGILLGTGGLVRAYTQAAKAGLENTPKGRLLFGRGLHISVPYDLVNPLLSYFQRSGTEPANASYLEKAEFDINIISGDIERVSADIAGLSAGRAEITAGEEGYFPAPDL